MLAQPGAERGREKSARALVLPAVGLPAEGPQGAEPVERPADNLVGAAVVPVEPAAVAADSQGKAQAEDVFAGTGPAGTGPAGTGPAGTGPAGTGCRTEAVDPGQGTRRARTRRA